MHTLRNFFRDRLLEIVIVGIGLQCLIGAILLFFENRPFLLMLIAISLILLAGLVTAASDIVKTRKKIIGDVFDPKMKRKGVIFTLGLKSHDVKSPAMKVIRQLSPQYCGFIGTKKTFDANIGRTIAQAADLKEDFYREKEVYPANIKEIKEDTVHLIQWMLDEGLSRSDIVVDITGGTAIVSLAAYMAADEYRIDTQYIYSEEYRDNQPVDGSQKAILVSRYEQG